MPVRVPLSLLFRGLILYSFLFVPIGLEIYTGYFLYDLTILGNFVHFIYFLEQVLGVFTFRVLYTFLSLFYSNCVSFLYIYNFLFFTNHSVLTVKWLVAVTCLCLCSLVLDLTHIIDKWSELYFVLKNIEVEDVNRYESSDDEKEFSDKEELEKVKKNN